MKSEASVVVFDLGGVLVDWSPRYLYRKLFNGDEAAMEHFLATVCTQAWNLQQDAGRSFAEACGFLKTIHPFALLGTQGPELFQPGPPAQHCMDMLRIRGTVLPLSLIAVLLSAGQCQIPTELPQ